MRAYCHRETIYWHDPPPPPYTVCRDLAETIPVVNPAVCALTDHRQSESATLRQTGFSLHSVQRSGRDYSSRKSCSVRTDRPPAE
ncbi:hypothetical protein J6590_019396 [Homalodisca vitripennis]|nr:hypothetical protein J6590_019396 [Homalodisca vitripennis]